MRDRGAYRPSGSFADLVGSPRITTIKAHCVRCGRALERKNKYCQPCSLDAAKEQDSARRAQRDRRSDALRAKRDREVRVVEAISAALAGLVSEISYCEGGGCIISLDDGHGLTTVHVIARQQGNTLEESPNPSKKTPRIG